MLDTSFKAPDELEKDLGMRILVSIPYRYTDAEIRRKKVKEVFKAASVGVGFVVGAAGIIVVARGPEKLLYYMKTLIGMI